MTEKEWLACDSPWDLARFTRGRVDAQRFRFLAVDWGSRIRQYFAEYDLPWYDAFVAWVAGTGEHPGVVCKVPEYVHFCSHGVSDDAGFFADYIRRNDPMMAAAFAGTGASQVWVRQQPPDFAKTIKVGGHKAT